MKENVITKRKSIKSNILQTLIMSAFTFILETSFSGCRHREDPSGRFLFPVLEAKYKKHLMTIITWIIKICILYKIYLKYLLCVFF